MLTGADSLDGRKTTSVWLSSAVAYVATVAKSAISDSVLPCIDHFGHIWPTAIIIVAVIIVLMYVDAYRPKLKLSICSICCRFVA